MGVIHVGINKFLAKMKFDGSKSELFAIVQNGDWKKGEKSGVEIIINFFYINIINYPNISVYSPFMSNLRLLLVNWSNLRTWKFFFPKKSVLFSIFLRKDHLITPILACTHHSCLT